MRHLKVRELAFCCLLFPTTPYKHLCSALKTCSICGLPPPSQFCLINTICEVENEEHIASWTRLQKLSNSFLWEDLEINPRFKLLEITHIACLS